MVPGFPKCLQDNRSERGLGGRIAYLFHQPLQQSTLQGPRAGTAVRHSPSSRQLGKGGYLPTIRCRRDFTLHHRGVCGRCILRRIPPLGNERFSGLQTDMRDHRISYFKQEGSTAFNEDGTPRSRRIITRHTSHGQVEGWSKQQAEISNFPSFTYKLPYASGGFQTTRQTGVLLITACRGTRPRHDGAPNQETIQAEWGLVYHRTFNGT